jgi:hypothetical protein
VMADPLNLLGVSAVPITLFVDEVGVIRAKNPKPDELKAFLGAEYENVRPTGDAVLIDPFYAKGRDINGYLVSGSEKDPFKLGVLHRMRYDSEWRQPGDFAAAVGYWKKALEMNPNQYIWRRRIQQYGPRLDKPYSFYDWVAEAREAIIARGGTPVTLIAEPGGAEFAQPGKAKGDAVEDEKYPDPDSKLLRDVGDFLKATFVVVPSTDQGKAAFRVYVSFAPDALKGVHWNNESGAAKLWIGAMRSVEVPMLANPPSNSDELRTVEFETDKLPIEATLFFDMCEGADGVCRHLAKEVLITK